MDDFLFSIEIVNAQILEDYRRYFPQAPKSKPLVHWGIEYEIKFMDEPIPEQDGMALSRRFMEITLRASDEPTPAIVARELVVRGGKSVGAAAVKARESWWNGKPAVVKKELTVQEEVELLEKTGHLPDEGGQQALPGLEQVPHKKAGKTRVKRRSH